MYTFAWWGHREHTIYTRSRVISDISYCFVPPAWGDNTISWASKLLFSAPWADFAGFLLSNSSGGVQKLIPDGSDFSSVFPSLLSGSLDSSIVLGFPVSLPSRCPVQKLPGLLDCRRERFFLILVEWFSTFDSEISYCEYMGEIIIELHPLHTLQTTNKLQTGYTFMVLQGKSSAWNSWS